MQSWVLSLWISIHAPAKGATYDYVCHRPILHEFQSTLPRRERPHYKIYWSLIRQFQSTLPRRERPFNLPMFQHQTQFQSTLPRRERRTPPDCHHASMQISIHAPAKGATLITINSYGMSLNFNPRSREGSDILPNGIVVIASNFNPRSREGSDMLGTAHLDQA